MTTAVLPKKAQKKHWAAEFGKREKAVEVFQTAARMIHERGFHATSMNDLAAVELTIPGLYHYIGSKQEMLFRIMTLAMNQLENLVVEPALKEQDAESRLRLIIVNHALLVTSGLGEITILVDEISGLSDAQRETVAERKRVYLNLIRETLDELKAEGKLREVDITTASFSLFGMILWLSR